MEQGKARIRKVDMIFHSSTSSQNPFKPQGPNGSVYINVNSSLGKGYVITIDAKNND